MGGKAHAVESTRELGLDLTQMAARHLFKTDHLHYGYWPDNLPVEVSNMREAQEIYADFLFQAIPAGVKSILDVGSGSGAFARRLRDAGYDVECVSPSVAQTKTVRTVLGEGTTIHECRFEDLQTAKQYDLVLFSESFQYVPLRISLPRCCELLRPHGHILICDFFRNETPNKGPFGGGHGYADFQSFAATLPLNTVRNEDITARMAPNLDLTAGFMTEVMLPARERIFGYLDGRYRWPFRALRWLFRKPLAEAEQKYVDGKRSGANFMVYKTYRLLLLQHCPERG